MMTALVVLLAVQNPENGQEQVEDIEVEADGCRNLLFHLVMTDDQLVSALANVALKSSNVYIPECRQECSR